MLGCSAEEVDADLQELEEKKVILKYHTFVDWEKAGGSPVLGVNGTVIKVHGRSKSKAISYAILGAANFVEHNGVGRIREEIARGGAE